jgi:hypothetical protein
MCEKNSRRQSRSRINVDARVWGFYTDGDFLGNKEGNLQKYETEREYLNLMKEDEEDVED